MRAVIACSIALVWSAVAAGAPPVTSFTNFPKFESMKVSPGGTYIAFTRHTTEFEVLTVLRLQDMKLSTQSHFGNRIDIASFEWANDTRLLISPTRRFPGLLAFKAPTGEIIGLDANGKAAELLFGYQAGKTQIGSRVAERQSVYSAGEIVSRLPDEPSEVLIQTYGYSTEGEFNFAYRMNVSNGKLRKVSGSPVRDGTFLTDLQRRIVFVYGEDREGKSQVFWRPAEGADWKLMSSTKMTEGAFRPVAPSGRAGEFYILDDRDAPTRGVSTWEPATGTHKLLYRHPMVNVALEGLDPAGKPWGFWYMDHFPDYWYPDPEHPLAKIHQWLRSVFRGHEIEITS